MATVQGTAAARRRWWVFALPLGAALALGAVLAVGLGRDPARLPSALVGRPAPEFSLPPLPGRDGGGLSTVDLKGGPMLVNVFASWCVPCRVEHPVLERLAEEGVAIQGINYKDRPADARAFLDELGDPYKRVGIDTNGRVGIDWGVYGVPETYVLDAKGQIVYRHVGPIQARDLERTILPILEELR